MKTPRIRINVLAMVVATLAAMPAAATTPSPDDLVVHIPATAIFATENKNGDFAVITDTGRFIIRGTIYDVWDQKEINTLEDARYAATHIPLHKTNVGFSDLKPFSVGQGEKVIHMFSDLQCSHCKQIIHEARRNMPEGYRLDVILLPLMGPESARRAEEVLCAEVPSDGWKAAVEGDMQTPIAQSDDCDTETLQRRMVTAQFLGARNVPFLIRDDGLVQQGAPANGFRAWVLANR